MGSLKTELSEISENSQENIYAGISFLIKQICNFIKSESLAKVFS